MVWSCLTNAVAVFVLVPKLCLLNSMGISYCLYRQWIRPTFFTFAFIIRLIFSNMVLSSLQLCVCMQMHADRHAI